VVVKYYRQHKPISISQGEKVAITGNNGSGKSSLLKLIGGIFEETAGQVKRSQINIGYVPPNYQGKLVGKMAEQKPGDC
jgi:ABC-type bacteriocin/lantibiotic exporter with double-glycine peptidase domain